MKSKVKNIREDRVISILYWVIALTSLVPLACGYIMTGGIIEEWIARVEELSMGGARLFPTAAVYFKANVNDNALNSNLPFWGSALLFYLKNDMALTYRITMLLIQVGTFLGARLFFITFFDKTDYGEQKALFGILLYMTNPWRISISYERADLSQTMAYMLLPFFAWAICRLIYFKGNSGLYYLISALSLAGIGYTHVVFFGSMVLLLITIIVMRKWYRGSLVLLMGSILAMPGLMALIRYLKSDIYAIWELRGQSIMPMGYQPAEFFLIFSHKEGHPGMGLGFMLCLGALLWIKFVEGIKETDRRIVLYECLFIVLAVMSLSCFPWEWTQRVSVIVLKSVGYIKTPGFFWGIACSSLCIPAGNACGRLAEVRGKKIATYFGVFVFVACISLSVWQCNMLTYTREPFIWQK